jgi:transcriptional regulator with PAS, ATPase and Fis domain
MRAATMDNTVSWYPGPPPEGGNRADGIEEIHGESRSMQRVFEQIYQAASTELPVLILGETGTGKELVARAIHQRSERSEGPYIPVNLGAIPTELVGSELFGHEKGAFTGAGERNRGRFEQAESGTLFLDEIATIDTKMQVSLLRVIEQKELYRLGGSRRIPTHARLIAASNENLARLVEQGRFRADLYYRLDVFRIPLPPLREREGDIPLLAEKFLERYSRDLGKDVYDISPDCGQSLESYPWPGNVRELKNVIQRAVLVCTGDVLLAEHLPGRFQNGGNRQRPPDEELFKIGTTLDSMEKRMILRTLENCGNNRTRAALLLGISRRALYNKLRKHSLA